MKRQIERVLLVLVMATLTARAAVLPAPVAAATASAGSLRNQTPAQAAAAPVSKSLPEAAPAALPAASAQPPVASSSEPSAAAAPASQPERKTPLELEADRLVAMATELKARVDKTNKNILSLSVVQQAEEIEHYAHQLKVAEKK